MPNFKFKILKKSRNSLARIGILETPHGEILTPTFIPVATQAAIKGLTQKQLEEIGSQAVLANTYHLYLRPGDELIKENGGLHKFMNWQKPIFTDSGGFQVFSLGAGLEHSIGKIANIFPKEAQSRDNIIDRGEHEWTEAKRKNGLVKINEEGVEFKSHIDGSKHFFTPEKSIDIQKNLGADLIFAFDECTSPLSTYEYTKLSMQRTHRWALRCLRAFSARGACLLGRQGSAFGGNGGKQAMYGIIQGGDYKDLRKKSSEFINSLNFFGIGIGGYLGKSKVDMYKVLKWTIPYLSENKPRHLLGIGSVNDIKKCIEHGVDTFDCVIPTRLARHGVAILQNKALNLKSKRYLNIKEPIDKKCNCYACQNFKLSYIAHLVNAKEIAGISLLAIHNLSFMERLFEQIRNNI